MSEIILIAHLSLDGFVAGENDELNKFNSGEENLEFVTQISLAGDTILSGRKTHELLDEFWTNAKDLPAATKGQIEYSKWYNSTHKLIISKTLSNLNKEKTTILNSDIISQVLKAKHESEKDIIIFASPSVSQLLMEHDLIDTYWIFINPVLFGKGIPLFKNANPNIKLKVSEIKHFSNDELAIKYTRE